MRQAIILSGPSGIGKSTHAYGLDLGRYHTRVVSADHFFSTVDGYRFDPSKLSEAHAQCFRRYCDALQPSAPMYGRLIVDNTNTTEMEIAPYVLAAQAYGWEPIVRTILPANYQTMDVASVASTLAKRNTHGVPEKTIEMQLRRLVERRLPPWWKSEVIEVAL